MTQQYWVRGPAGVQGPFDASKIRQLVADKQLTPEMEISKDGVGWQSASKTRGLFPTPETPPILEFAAGPPIPLPESSPAPVAPPLGPPNQSARLARFNISGTSWVKIAAFAVLLGTVGYRSHVFESLGLGGSQPRKLTTAAGNASAPQVHASNSLDEEATRLATSYFQSLWIDCGDFWAHKPPTQPHFPDTYSEIKDPIVELTYRYKLNDADAMNGLDFQGIFALGSRFARRYKFDYIDRKSGWEDWVDMKGGPIFEDIGSNQSSDASAISIKHVKGQWFTDPSFVAGARPTLTCAQVPR